MTRADRKDPDGTSPRQEPARAATATRNGLRTRMPNMGRQGAGCYSSPALGLEAGAEARPLALKDAVPHKLFGRPQIYCRARAD